MKRSLTVVAAVVTLTLSGCGGGNSDEPAGDTAAAGEIDRDATLRFAWTVAPTNMDPHTTVDPRVGFPTLSPVYDRLTMVTRASADAPFEISPMLAESWEFSEDGLTLTLTLRDDATFHDGSPVDSEAVKFSLERGKTLPGSTAAFALSVIDTIDAPDPGTVVLNLNRPAADLLFTLADVTGMILNPARLNSGVDPAREDAGSGPYKLTELRSGDRTVYERASEYWDPEAQKPAGLEIIGIVDDNARLNAMRSGQVDGVLIKLGQHDQAEQIAQGSDAEVISSGPRSWYAMFLNADFPPLEDVKVRQALNFAIDRDAINETVLDGQCPATSQPLQEGEVGYDPDSAGRYTYDPDRARELLAEAGYPDGFEVDLLVQSGLSPQVELAPILQAQLAEVGVDATLTTLDLLATSRTWNGGQSGTYVHVNSSTAEPAVTLTQAYQDASYPGPAPAGFDELMARASDATLSPEAREEALQAVSAFASENAMDAFICALPTQYVVSDSVVGMETNGAPWGGIFDLRYVGLTE
ncbi:ABC transporter substrate-binding protein [uncultured Modestobacter sp.]|uniref:ABC transporter substrate-binding protein n=1 Tax=uncultured Modestobacter sp. TaxID=380048 RepID=UPI002618ED83|nr:ABC transporter substrate-binding protein [uncultured Modestobacter sp.]